MCIRDRDLTQESTSQTLTTNVPATHQESASKTSVQEPIHQVSASQTSTAQDSIDPSICFLCDDPVTVKLLPCGHAIICSSCAQRAKKCLKCRGVVTAIVNMEKL